MCEGKNDMDFIKVEPDPDNESNLTSSTDGNQLIDVKEEEHPVLTFQDMRTQNDLATSFIKLEPVSYCETNLTPSHSENQMIDIKEEADPLLETFPVVKVENESDMDFMVVEPDPDSESNLTSSLDGNKLIGVTDDVLPTFQGMTTEHEFVGKLASTPRSVSAAEVEAELIFDSDSDAYDELSDVEESEWEEEEEEVMVEGNLEGEEQATGVDNAGRANWRPIRRRDRRVVHPFTGESSGLRTNEAPEVNKDSSPLSFFMLLFAGVLQLLVEETNRYYHQYLDTVDKESSPQPDVTVPEMCLFLALIIQMGHDLRDRLSDYWLTHEQFHTPFYGNTMRRDRFNIILRFLHFSDNQNEPDKSDENYDRLWKMRKIFDMISDSFSRFYSPSENLAVNRLIVLYKGRIVFKEYIPKRNKHFGIKIYKLCDTEGYTYDMVSLGKDRQGARQDMTGTHATVLNLTRRVVGVGHKLYMDDFFSSPDLYDDLQTKRINCCGTVRPNQRGMPPDFGRKKLRTGDVRARTRGDLTAIVWRVKRNVHMLTNMHHPPRDGNYCDEYKNAQKPAIVEDYNRNVSFVNRFNRMASRYSISRRSLKWTKKLFFHFLDLTILNSWILHKSSGAKLSHSNFRLQLVRDLLEMGARDLHPKYTSLGRPSPSAAKFARLEVRFSRHWPAKGKRLRCRVCAARKKDTRTTYRCEQCDVGLCIIPCFRDYHTILHL